MRKRLLNHNADWKITEWFIPSSDGKTFTVQTTQDCTDIVSNSKASYAQFDERANWKGDWHRVASIPLHVWMGLKKAGVTESKAKMSRWLNDPDNRYLRTRPGKV